MYRQIVKHIAFGVIRSVLKTYFALPCDKFYFFATATKYIAPPTFNHIIYNMINFLLVSAKKKILKMPPEHFILSGNQ